MERLSVIDDDFEESPSLSLSKSLCHDYCDPLSSLRKCWIHSPRTACTFLSLLILFPLIITFTTLSLSLYSSSSSLTSTSSSPLECDQTNAWARSFQIDNHGEGIVSSDDFRCSEIGSNILKENGNAIDAAIGMTLCLGVVSPASSGLGGGCFILGYNTTTKTSLFIDAREIAPKKSIKKYVSKSICILC